MLSGRHETSILDRSTDGGATWNTVDTLPADIGFATAPLVIDAQTFLLGTVNGAKSGIYRSTDQGASWTLVRPGGVSGKALVAKDRTIYWVLNGGDVLATSVVGTGTRFVLQLPAG